MLRSITAVFHDLAASLRLLRRHPGLSLLAIVALLIGIGLTASMFGLLDAAVLRGLPFEDAHQLMHIESYRASDRTRYLVRLHDLADWRRATDGLRRARCTMNDGSNPR